MFYVYATVKYNFNQKIQKMIRKFKPRKKINYKLIIIVSVSASLFYLLTGLGLLEISALLIGFLIGKSTKEI